MINYTQHSITDTLAISEATKSQIICEDESIKQIYSELADFFKYSIPEPLTIFEFLDSKEPELKVMLGDHKVLYDFIANAMLKQSVHKKIQIKKSDALDLLGFDKNKYEIIDG